MNENVRHRKAIMRELDLISRLSDNPHRATNAQLEQYIKPLLKGDNRVADEYDAFFLAIHLSADRARRRLVQLLKL